MPVTTFPSLPKTHEPVAVWEAYLKQLLERPSQVRIRTSRLTESPLSREQQFLRRLKLSAALNFQNSSLAVAVPALQRQALELIQLRRYLIPDHTGLMQQGEIFLAVHEMHRAIHALLEQIDSYQFYHEEVSAQSRVWQKICTEIISGSPADPQELRQLTQLVRKMAADAQLTPLRWFDLCRGLAEYETRKLNRYQQSALAQGLIAAYLAARILPRFTRLLPAEDLLLACLFKDVAWMIPNVDEQRLSRGYHCEWSAGLMATSCPRLIALPRLIRQHHECFNGSGLPAGAASPDLRRDDRLLGLLTRWTELFVRHHEFYSPLQQLTADSLVIATDIVSTECQQGRWDANWLKELRHEILPPQTVSQKNVQPHVNANPHWHVPRPHFMGRRVVTKRSQNQPAMTEQD